MDPSQEDLWLKREKHLWQRRLSVHQRGMPYFHLQELVLGDTEHFPPSFAFSLRTRLASASGTEEKMACAACGVIQ